MHPTRVVGVELHRTADDCRASLEFAGVHDLQSQDSDRVGVERIEGHRALGRGQRREIPAEEVVCASATSANWFANRVTPRRAAARARSREPASLPEAKRVFVDEDLREAGPEVRLAAVPLHPRSRRPLSSA